MAWGVFYLCGVFAKEYYDAWECGEGGGAERDGQGGGGDWLDCGVASGYSMIYDAYQVW